MFDIDENGLDHLDRHILKTIVSVFGGGPVGVTACSSYRRRSRTIEDVYEPYLIQLGLMQRTARADASPAWDASICSVPLPEQLSR